MQCYGYEALCRSLIAFVKQQYPGIDFDIADAADVIDAHGIDSVEQIPELDAIARDIGLRMQRAA